MSLRTALLTLICVASIFLMGFSSRTERWSEDVVLHDRTLIKVEREVDYTFQFVSGDEASMVLFGSWPDRFWLKFQNPVTKETITWRGEQYFHPVLLDVLDSIPYLVVMGRPTKDNESIYGCPELPFIYLKYKSGFFGKWLPVPVEEAPDALKNPNLSPQYPDFGKVDESFESVLTKQRGRPRIDMSTNDVGEVIEKFTRTPERQLNKPIPRTYEAWRYAYKNGYRNERRNGDCRPPRSPLPPVILPAATEVPLELLHSMEHTPVLVVADDEWARLTYDRVREEACIGMFKPVDPDDYMMGERFTNDNTMKKRVPYSVNSQRQTGVRQVCDSHIWFITHLEDRDKMIITKFTITGDLIYRISFRRPEAIQGFVGYIAIPSLKSEGGYLYFDWLDFRDRWWDIKRIMKLRLLEPILLNNR
jgi:hypothetical protein